MRTFYANIKFVSSLDVGGKTLKRQNLKPASDTRAANHTAATLSRGQ